MKKLKKEEMTKVKGGATSITSMLNALMKTVATMFSLGQAVGSAIRRSSTRNYC